MRLENIEKRASDYKYFFCTLVSQCYLQVAELRAVRI